LFDLKLPYFSRVDDLYNAFLSEYKSFSNEFLASSLDAVRG
jgi:hypothetical protein